MFFSIAGKREIINNPNVHHSFGVWFGKMSPLPNWGCWAS